MNDEDCVERLDRQRQDFRDELEAANADAARLWDAIEMALNYHHVSHIHAALRDARNAHLDRIAGRGD